jgi:hypothetical protein
VDSYLGPLLGSIALHVCVVSMPCYFYCYCFVILFEVMYYDTTNIVLFAEYCLGYSQSIVFPNEL